MNKWKRAFLILAGIDLIFIIAVAVMLIMLSQAKTPMPPAAKNIAQDPVFTVSSDKKQLADMVNSEITKHPAGNLDFHVELSNTLDIIGQLKLFGLAIPFTMRFNPSVDAQGNVVLKEKDVKLGQFELPESQVLKFIQAGAGLPDWIYINPGKKEIYVDMNHVVIQDRFYLKAKEIDLANNKIIFNVYRKTAGKK
ncbi:MAG: YpmS family protein [Tuberibacillus sp.]